MIDIVTVWGEVTQSGEKLFVLVYCPNEEQRYVVKTIDVSELSSDMYELLLMSAMVTERLKRSTELLRRKTNEIQGRSGQSGS